MKGSHGKKADREKAIQLFREAVSQGHIEANIKLATALKQDESHLIEHGLEIVQLLSEAAEKDYPEAHFNLGQLYFYGIETVLEVDYRKAKEHFESLLEKLPPTHYVARRSNSFLQKIIISELAL